VSREAAQFPPFDLFFDCVPELVAVVGVIVLASVETTVFGFIRLGRFFQWMRLSDARLLKLCVEAFVKDHLS